MPVLENVHVQLSEVLEVRGLPLNEDELWALLCLTLDSIQDLFLTGAAFKNEAPAYLLNPVTLQCTSSGRVLITKSSPVDLHREYWAPELLNSNHSTSEEDLGKVYVYSLGKTLQFAVENDPEYLNKSNWFSPLFNNTIQSMVQEDSRLRISLQGLSKVCNRYTSSLPNEHSYTSLIIQLHQEVLGNLPEAEILNQVDKDFVEENARMSFSVSHNEESTRNRSDTLDSIDDAIYGRCLDYRAKTEIPHLLDNSERRLNPRERWRKAYLQIAHYRKQALSQLNNNNSSILDNRSAKSSMFKGYQELAERRRMLELLRLNIDTGQPAIKGIEKGLKPKTLAELVLLLKNNPTKSVTSTDHSLSDPGKKRLKLTSRSSSMCRDKRSSISDLYSLQAKTSPAFEDTSQNACGPEFVFHRTTSPSPLNLCSMRKLQTGSPKGPPCNLTIVLVTGQRLVVTCDPNISGTTLFHAIAHYIMLLEHYLFGLAVNRDGEFLFLDGRQHLQKVISSLSSSKVTEMETLTLHLRIKYYLTDINLIKHKATRHLYYLQTRCDCLEQRFRCNEEATITLAGLALQAEFGDFVGREDFFILDDYVPDSLFKFFGRAEATKQLISQHSKHIGISKDMAELQFVQNVCELPEYGYHFHKVFQDKHDMNSEVWLSINAQGIGIFEEKDQERSKCQSYLWPEIEKLSFTRKSFNITPKTTNLTGKSVKYTFHTMDAFKSRYLFNMAVGHHQFFVKLKSGANASEIIMEDIELENCNPRIVQDNSASTDTDEEVECSFENNLSASWLSSVRNKYLDKMNDFSSRRKNCSFSPLGSARKRTSDEDDHKGRRRRTLDSVDMSDVQNDTPSFLSSSKIRPLSLTPYRRQVLRGALDLVKPIIVDEEWNLTKDENQVAKESLLHWVTLQKSLDHGFGLVLTCGDTLDTVISGTFIESVHQPQNDNIEPGDKVIWLNGQNVENKNYLEVASLLQSVSGSARLGLQRRPTSTCAQDLKSNFGKEKSTPDGGGQLANCESSPESYGTMEFSFFNEEDPLPPQPRPRRKKSTKSLKSLSEGFPLSRQNVVSAGDDDISTLRINEGLTLNGSALPLATVPCFNLQPRDTNECTGAVLTTNSSEFDRNVPGETPTPMSVNPSQEEISLLGSVRKTSTDGQCLEEFSGKSYRIGESDLVESSDFTGLCDNQWTLKSCVGEVHQMFSARTRADLHYWKTGQEGRVSIPCDGEKMKGDEDTWEESDREEKEEEKDEMLHDRVTIIAVSLTKQEGSFGFRVTERYQFGETYERGIFVHSLILDGSAEKDANIQAGDKLIRINGVQTEPLSYQESVGLLKKCPTTCELHFGRRSADVGVEESSPTVDAADGGSADAMIAKWGRLGSRTSLSSLPGEEETLENASGRPVYGRSVSQFSLPPIHLPTVNARSRSGSLSDDASYSVPRLPNGHGIQRNYLDLPSPELSPEQSSTFPRKSKSKSPTTLEDSLSDSVFSDLDLSSQHTYVRSVSAPLLAVPKTGPPRSSNSPSSLHKETLGVVPEDYSLDRFDNVFTRQDSFELSFPMSETASKYAVPKCGSSLTKWNGSLQQEERNNKTAVTPDSDDDDRPPVIVRKKRAGLLEKPTDVYKYLTPRNTSEILLQKTSRGLGLGVFGGSDLERLGPVCQLVRVRKIYPLQPALESGKIAVGDVILQVNGQSTLGLTHTEALELLRVAPMNVLLKIYRPNAAVMPPVSFYIKDVSPNSSFLISPPGSACNTLSKPKSSQEYETTLLKKEGSLGFSIVRHEHMHSDDGHPTGIYVKALVREPALSHHKLRPGDRILLVNGEDISRMSHSEAVSFLRQASETVTLHLFPNSDPLWPQCLEDDPGKPAKPLRKEAMDMLSNRAKQKEGKTSPRRLKLKRTESDSLSSSGDDLSEGNPSPKLVLPINKEQPDCEVPTEGLLRSLRPKSLDGLSFNEKKQSFNGIERTNNDLSFQRQGSVLEPAGKDLGTEGAGLLKWRGATLHSNGEGNSASPSSGSIDLSGLQVSRSDAESTPAPSPVPIPPHRIQSLPFEEENLTNRNGHLKTNKDHTPQVVKVYIEMDRGWHGRLGFSLSDILPNEKSNPLSHYTSPVVRAVHPGSVAYKDGRIRVGDRLVMVNGESMVDRPAAEVIDLLRKTRGKMRMDLLRVQQESDSTSHSSVGSS